MSKLSTFGAFGGGVAAGVMAGQRQRLEQERAERERKSQELRDQVIQRDLEKDRKLQEAYQDIAEEAVKRSGVKIPMQQSGEDASGNVAAPQAPSAHMQLGFALDQAPDLFRDREFLNKAASAFLTRGLPDGVRWLEAGHKAATEGYQEALKELMNGNVDAAEAAFNKSGKMKLPRGGIVPVEGKPGTFAITGTNGQTMELDAKQAYINLLPPEKFAEFQMKKPYYDALAKYQGGRNEANVEGRQISADARVEAAGVAADSRENVAATRGGARGPGGGVRGAGGGTAMYGGDKGAAKWVDDFEKHYIPKADMKNADGTAKIDPKTGQPVQEVDAEVAPVVRDMARVNKDVLAAGGVHPQEASNVFTQFAKAFKTGDRAKMFADLDKAGRVAIVENDEGEPVKAVGIMGQYRDERGQVRPMFFELPEGMSTELVTQEAVNRVEKQKKYPDETRRGPMKGSRAAAAPVARRGVKPSHPGHFGPMQPN